MIVKKLSSEIYSHRHAISRTEAIQFLELKQVVKAEDQGIDTELWELYTEYESMFDMSDPFSPESYLLDNKLREHTWQKLPLACVESTEGLDTESVDVRLRSILQPEPNITLNLQNYQLPPINFGDLPQGLTPEQFQAFVGQLIQNYTQTALNAALGNAIEAIMNRMPSAGFERSDFNRKWITEVNDMTKKLSASATNKATPSVTLKPTVNQNSTFQVSLYQNAKIVSGNVSSKRKPNEQSVLQIEIYPNFVND